MDMIESIKQNKAYNKCKLIVKKWEKEFKVKHSRTPSKFDIKEAPSKIKYAYKKYFQLKSTALENSLLCDFDDESFKSPDEVQHLEELPYETPSPQSELLLQSLPSGQEIELMLSSDIKPEVKVKKNLSQSPSMLQNKSEIVNPVSPFTENLSKKLFQNKKFSLRNPRKFSFTKSQSSADLSQNSFDDNSLKEYKNSSLEVTDYTHTKENIDVNISWPTTSKSLNKHDLKSSEIFIKQTSFDINKSGHVRQLNTAWLERAAGINVPKTEDNILPPQQLEKFGLRNIQLQDKAIKSNTDFIENSESESEDIPLAKIRPALKKRKIDNVTSIAITKKDIEEDIKKDIDITPEDNSKKSKKTKSKRKSKPVKNIDEGSEKMPDITEYVPFGAEKEILPRHNTFSSVLSSVDTSLQNSSVNKNTSEGFSKLELRIKSGTLNENFVKVNIEKKVFVRGKKNFSYSKHKKQLNKDKKALHYSMEFPEAGKITCFKCGNTGHMARYCTAHKGETLLPLESYNEDDIPSLEDMQNVVDNETNTSSLTEQLSQSIFQPTEIPDYVMKMLNEKPSLDVTPVYLENQNEIPKEVFEALNKFGYDDFRPGQSEAIMRILHGKSTLLLLSTGGGKSLCYQLPAYIYSQHFKCITLVISPLVSLMEDQVLNMPEFVKAGCLHTNQPPTQRQKIIQCLKDGEINVLLISPEALLSGDGSSGFTGLFKSLPPIAFACIDEAHCVSQWSHNFRPSYLMLCRILREKLNVKCILGLTATASKPAIKSIITHIQVPDGEKGVITNPALPENLHLSVSLERDKDRALLTYLTSERISSFNSIIVYCIRRDECVRVAALLRSCLQEPGKINMEKPSNKRKRMSYIAEAYHAGMSGAQRKKIQKNFMDGTLRIIVATVAFGMGINKSDIRCIVHYNMPSSFESYVQEVGRAGRDGQDAYCHVFMNNDCNDKNELLKHIHANTIERPTLRKLLQKVFIPCDCSKDDLKCKGHEVGIPIDSTVEELDLPSENIATLLCYIELHPRNYIKVLNNAYTLCKISSYGGPQKILEAAKKFPPLAMAYLLESKRNPDVTKMSVIEFNIIEAAAAVGWDSGVTKYKLKNMEWISDEKTGRFQRSQLKVEFNTLGFRLKAPGDLTATELDSMLDELHQSVLLQEKTMLYQLEECHKAFKKIGNYSIEKTETTQEFIKEKSNKLKDTIRTYFMREDIFANDLTLEERPLDVERVTSDVRALISSYKDCSFNGRSIARILQGIPSPNYTAIVWGRCKFWRSHMHEDFYGLVKIATQQIIQMKM